MECYKLVATSDDDTFRTEVAEYFDMPVLIDYYIFLNVVNGIDNIGKICIGLSMTRLRVKN